MAKRDSFLLRLNPATMEALRRWADDEFRSVNSQIEATLQRALRDAGRIPKSVDISGENEKGADEASPPECDQSDAPS